MYYNYMVLAYTCQKMITALGQSEETSRNDELILYIIFVVLLGITQVKYFKLAVNCYSLIP